MLATRFIRDYPELYRTYDSAKQFTYNNITQSNRNRLLWLDPSVDGLKTGHTDAAGTAWWPPRAGPMAPTSVA